MSCIKSCSHEVTIEDHRTGDVVCELCALVVSEKMMISSYIGREPLLLKDEFNAIDSYHLMLIDFCFNASLPVNLALTAYNLYKKNRNQRKLNLITNNTKELLFAAMYITLHNSGSSYTLKEIVAHSNTDVKTLSRLTKIYFEKDMVDECYPSASNLIQRLCANLQIDRRNAMKIFKAVSSFEEKVSIGLNPSTIATAFVYQHIEKHPMNITITLQDICEMAGTSPVTVKRFLHRFKMELYAVQDFDQSEMDSLCTGFFQNGL